MRVMGFDLGFGHVKVVSHVSFSFPSQLAFYVEDGLSDVRKIEHEGKYYVVGEQSLAFSQKQSLASLDLLIKYSPVFLKYVLEELGIKEELVVVSGLPPRFKNYAQIYKEKLLSVGGVQKVVIVPQTVGILEDVRTKAGLYEEGLIVDIGFNTVDYLAYRHTKGEFLKERSGTIENLGVKSAVESFRTLLPEELGHRKNAPFVFLNSIFVSGFAQTGGKHINLLNIKRRVLEMWNEQLLARLTEEVGEFLKERSLIVVAGGGAYLVDKAIFGREVYVPQEPEFSNARGYYRIGLQQV